MTNELSQPNKIIQRGKISRSEKRFDDPSYKEKNLEHLKKSIEQLKSGEVVGKSFDKLRKLVNGII